MRDVIEAASRLYGTLTGEVAYEVTCFNGDHRTSSDIRARKVIYASGKDDLTNKVKIWMDYIGLDPEDEHDQAKIAIGVV